MLKEGVFESLVFFCLAVVFCLLRTPLIGAPDEIQRVEMAGYLVTTAIDGMEAFSTLKTEDIDLVVSDVDMPRMNGFVLTSKIRKEKKLSELPVVLVTALESREDREQGIDAGANAYIIKSSFDQSNLLEVIERLI